MFLLMTENKFFSQEKLELGQVFILPEVRFPFCMRFGIEDDVIEEMNGKIFDSISDFLKIYKSYSFELRAHTDSRGSDSMNLLISQQRAEKIVSYLLKRNVNPYQIKALGYGESNPRLVCLIDSIIQTQKPLNYEGEEILLTEDYIKQFANKNKLNTEKLHTYNRRIELVVIEEH
jgi:peptidoglycan-associated lipoprotein